MYKRIIQTVVMIFFSDNEYINAYISYWVTVADGMTVYRTFHRA
jgi:hypothetical protein